MAKEYLVWVCVEEYDTVAEKGEDIDMPFGEKQRFSGRRAAQNAVDYATALQEARLFNWRGRGKKVAQ